MVLEMFVAEYVKQNGVQLAWNHGLVLPQCVLLVMLLAVLYIWKVVEAAYFQEPPEGAECKDAPWGLLVPTYLLIGASFYFGIFTDPMLASAREAADLLLTAGGVK